jgi:hypothetical protein
MGFINYLYLILQINSQTLQVTAVCDNFWELNGLSYWLGEYLILQPVVNLFAMDFLSLYLSVHSDHLSLSKKKKDQFRPNSNQAIRLTN